MLNSKSVVSFSQCALCTEAACCIEQDSSARPLLTVAFCSEHKLVAERFDMVRCELSSTVAVESVCPQRPPLPLPADFVAMYLDVERKNKTIMARVWRAAYWPRRLLYRFWLWATQRRLLPLLMEYPECLSRE